MNIKEKIKEIEEHVNCHFHANNDKNVFYKYNEWTGWRFYVKAIRNKDWKSIKKNGFIVKSNQYKSMSYPQF